MRVAICGQFSEGARALGLVRSAAAQLAEAGIETARLDAEILMAEAAGTSRPRLLAGLVAFTPGLRAHFAEFVARRARREPIAYILGRKEFFSLDFAVTPSVLIPRPETETLVAAALDFVAGRPDSPVIDIGTGPGTIAIAIAGNAPRAGIVATDISGQALAVARDNAGRLGCADRIDFRRADCWAALDGGASPGRFGLVVSNPPYIPDGELDILSPEIRFEPRLALAGGPDGLDFYRRLAAEIRDHLEPAGRVLVEVGTRDQAAAVAAIFRCAGCTATEVIGDLAGEARVVRADF
jgi:release factor glutamine methyltransferase